MQFIRYAFVGLVNSAFGYLVIFGLMLRFGISPTLSNAIGYACGLVLSFYLNRNFTFSSTGRVNLEFFRFLVVFGVSYLTNLGILLAVLYRLPGEQVLAQVLAGIAYVGCSYFLNKTFVFRARSTGADYTPH